MQPFLSRVAEHIHQNYAEKTEKLCLVLPNKRGALFLKKHLAQKFGRNIWVPEIISAEELIEKLSGLQQLEEIELLCRLYTSYIFIVKENPEPFDSFAKWGNIILQDFNEIDRYLADAHDLYSNLRSIKEIENWSLAKEELSEFQKNYIHFMGSLAGIYDNFTQNLLKEKKAYQGLSYREAVNRFKSNGFSETYEKIIFCGFNALNKAELKIFSELFNSKKAEMLWDADRYYTENSGHEAGMFLRKNQEIFSEKKSIITSDNFKEQKDIELIAVPGSTGQALCVRETVISLLQSGQKADTIAIVLANENLLWPVLKFLPEEIRSVNITMEYPLKFTSPYNFIDLLLKIQQGYEKQTRQSKYIYYKEFLVLIKHPFFSEYAGILGISDTDKIISRVNEKNYAFIESVQLRECFGEKFELVQNLFLPWLNSVNAASVITSVLNKVREFYFESDTGSFRQLELEYTEVIIKNFKRVKDFVESYRYLSSIRSLRILYTQIVGNSSVAFLGEPLSGIQIMGVLETRTLDFENVILVSANEGVLPSGKSMNSFIPNDLKRHFGLPLYHAKDAIYSYHFYRLLQRAKNVRVIYDTETDTFGKGEKSRFISQLEYELPEYNPQVNIKNRIARMDSDVISEKSEVVIPKTDHALKLIFKKALSNDEFNGISPSSVLSYKACTLKFYFRYGAGLKEVEEVEESAEAGTFGTILHATLEDLYKPFVGQTLAVEKIAELTGKSEYAVEKCFANFFSGNEAFSGKNLLQQNVLKIYVNKLIQADVAQIKIAGGGKMKLLALEKELCASLTVVIKGVQETVFVKGKADRIDICDKHFRIIDYKSSIRKDDKFEFKGFNEMMEVKGYDKMYQLFFYAWLSWKNNIAPAAAILPGIIPFREFKEHPVYITQNKTALIFTDELLNEFEKCLSSKISEIFNPEIPFIPTSNEDNCKFCEYAPVCMR